MFEIKKSSVFSGIIHQIREINLKKIMQNIWKIQLFEELSNSTEIIEY